MPNNVMAKAMGTEPRAFPNRTPARYTLRATASALIIAANFFAVGVNFATAADRASYGVNRTVPKVTPPADLHFSSPPTDAEFLHTGLFAEPLAPVGVTTPADNRDLEQSVLAYRDAVRESGAADAVEPLLGYLAAHPNSPWKPALRLNIGMIYRQTGHFSKALDIWAAAWRDLSTRGGNPSTGRSTVTPRICVVRSGNYGAPPAPDAGSCAGT